MGRSGKKGRVAMSRGGAFKLLGFLWGSTSSLMF